MRLARLDLLRYGRFTDRILDLTVGKRDLHIVVGRNEAGKSTALSAIEDLLFGIPMRSPYNFLHDYADLRIGGVIEDGSQRLELRRRKGSKDTVLTADEDAIPEGEGALAPFLGMADRSFLERMFSLDHQRLREGGKEILEASEEIGQMLFATSAGLTGFTDTLRALQDEADRLWAPRKAGHRRYYQALERFESATADLREHIVTARDWKKLRRALEEAETACRSIEKEIEAVTAQLRRLGRIRRVYRDVRDMSELDRELAELKDAPELPADASQVLEAAEREHAETSRVLTHVGEQIEGVRHEREQLVCDDRIIAREADIAELDERRITVREGKADLPKRRAELANLEESVRRLARELGWEADDPQELIGKIPSRALVKGVRALLNERGEHASAVRAARKAAEEATRQVTTTGDALEAQPELTDVTPLELVVRAIRERGDLANEIHRAEEDRVAAQADCERRMRGLRPPVADVEVLAAVPVPPRATVHAHRDRARELEAQAQGAKEAVRAAERQLEKDQRAAQRLARSEDLVDRAELVEARERRDHGWSVIRQRYVDGGTVTATDMRAFVGVDDPLAQTVIIAFEEAVRHADERADRRFETAEASAKLSVTNRKIDEQRETLALHTAELEALREELHALEGRWNGMWSEAPFEPLTPDEMLGWLETRGEALDAAAQLADADRRLQALRTEEAAARQRVLDQLTVHVSSTDWLGEQPLAVVLKAADDALGAHRLARDAREQLKVRYREAEAKAQQLARSLQEAEEAWQEWESRWREALAGVGVDVTASPETVAAQMEAIDEMRSSAAAAQSLRHERIGKIERDVAAFSENVTRLAEAVAPELSGGDPEAVIVQIVARLQEAKRIRADQQNKDEQIAELADTMETQEGLRRGARETIARLRDMAGVANVDELRAAIERSDRRRQVVAERDRTLDRLREQGDGLPIEELERECREVSLDNAVAAEEQLQQRLDELRERQMGAREGRNEARRAFEAVGGDDQAARAEAARQDALAEMREAAEQYARVRSAATLLSWAIERYRREQQAPMLRRASERFAMLTNGSFEALRVELDDKDVAHLIGVRPDGERVAVSGMSTGTADQLYLALRIAAVTDYLDRAAGLPFIADDLFINFDDDRAAAGFRVLGELAERTQVLFFTHHQHLVEIARATLGAGLSVVSLDGDATGVVSDSR